MAVPSEFAANCSGSKRYLHRDPAVCAGLFNCFARVSVHGMCAFVCLNLI